MRNKALLMSMMLLLLPALICAKPIDVFLIGGQSNTTGMGVVRNIPSTYKIDESVKFFYSRYMNKGEGAMEWRSLCPASDNPKKFGFEISLGTRLKSSLPDREIALIKHSRSGSNLHTQWNPDGEGGEEYNKFVECVDRALAELREMGYTPTIRAMTWQQGEADARFDAGLENSNLYAKNLSHFIDSVRKRFSAPDMLFVYGEVMPLAAERFSQRDTVRASQIAVSEIAQTRYSVKGAILVEGDDLQMRHSDYRTDAPKDDVHLGSFGLLNLGERFADAILKRLDL